MNPLLRPRARWFAYGLGLLLGVTLSANAAGPWRVRHVSARDLTNGFAVDPLANDALRPAERSFLTKAVEGSRQQMRLAEVGVSQAVSSEVRSHAQQLVGDYRTLNDALETLIRQKGGIAGAPVGGTSENYQKLVEKTGDSFDREFVRTIAQATDEMLTLFEQVASDSRDSDVRALAAAQIPVIRAHRTAVTELKKTIN
jgi:putative membrane protein